MAKRSESRGRATYVAIIGLAGVFGGLGGYFGGFAGGAVGAVVGVVGPFLVTLWKERISTRQRIIAEFNEIALPMPSRAKAKGTIEGFAALLRPELGVVPFVGRKNDLDRLRAWAKGHEGPVMLVTGGAGVGKTRLALEFADELAKQGWLTAVVRQDQEADAVRRTLARLVIHRRQASAADRALLILDYAETRGGLPQVLDQVLAGRDRIRVLLLARDAGEWWTTNLAASSAAREAFASDLPLVLATQVLDNQNDKQIIEKAMPRFAEALELPAPTTVPTASTLLHGMPTILNLHAAALLAVLANEGSYEQVADDVVDALLGHEMRYWQRSARQKALSLDLPVLSRAVAVACLIPVPNEPATLEDTLATVLERVPDLAGAPALIRRDVARWLAALYPASASSGIGSLQPDLFAERLVCNELRRDADFQRRALTNLTATEAEHALTVLTRASRHDPAARPILRDALSADLSTLAPVAIKVATQTAGELANVLTEVLASAQTDLDTLDRISHEIPDQTVALAATAAVVAQRVVDMSHELPAADLAYAEGDAGARWLDIGDVQRARRNLLSAARRYELLAARDPLNHAEHYAWVLGNLGRAFRDSGGQSQAVEYLRRSVSILKPLAESSERARKALAGSLRSLGDILETDKDSAREYTQRALDIFDGLAQASSAGGTEYLPEIAACKYILGTLLRDSNPTQARQMYEDAVVGYEELVRLNPDAHRPGLAQSLSDLGELLIPTEPAAAIRKLTQAEGVYTVLVDHDPEKFEPGLVHTLGLLARAEASASNLTGAVRHAEQAVNRLERLVVTDRKRYEPDLAAALGALSDYYRAADRDAQRAFSPAQRAADIYTHLGQESGYQADLAVALHRLGELWAMTDYRRALEPMARAVDAYDAAITSDTSATDMTVGLARSLLELGLLNVRVRRNNEAVANVARVVEIIEGFNGDDMAKVLQSGARRIRRADPSTFDAIWRATIGSNPPAWLTVDARPSTR